MADSQSISEEYIHKEDAESGIVLPIGHLQVLLKPKDLRIADVCAIEE